MPKVVPIEVFLISKSTLDRAEVQRWLDFKGVEEFRLPPEEELSDRAGVIALGGKRCYMSFEVNEALNPNITKIRKDYAAYFDNILASGHGCYDAATDVLTADGWKSWPDVVADDYLATLSRDGVIAYRQPVRLVAAPYEGRMYRVEASGVDLFVTPNHRMFVCPTTTKLGRKRLFSSYTCVPAEELGHQSHAYLKSGRWVEPACSGVAFSPDELRLLGFAIGDGHYQGNGNVVRFRLRRERKIAWLTALTRRLGWAMQTNGDRFSVTAEPIADLLRQMYTEDGDKQIPQVLLTTQTAAALEGLFEGLMQSDGSCGRTGDSFDTTSETLAGQFQQLCLHVGLAANYGYTYGPDERPSSYGDKPLTRLHVIRRNLKTEVNKWADQAGRSSWVDDWAGEVFCAEMPEDTLRVVYVRRNGQPVWCGNSVLEHASYTLAIENVSRIFTAEMNRHRAGWAVSEGSMRFIRCGESIPYWLPDSISGPDVPGVNEAGLVYAAHHIGARPHRSELAELGIVGLDAKRHATRILSREAFSAQENVYRWLEAIWADELDPKSTFKGKKEITSMMRRIVGMGVATGGIWTGNIRALRHVITMRARPEAEEEICHVFTRVAKVLRDNEPHLFGDFEQDDHGFWYPKYVKV